MDGASAVQVAGNRLADALATAQRLVEDLADAAILLDSELRFLASNSHLAALLRTSPRAMRQRIEETPNVLDVLGECGPRFRELTLECLQQGRSIHMAEVSMVDSKDNALTVNVSQLPVVSGSGETIGVIHVLRDVTAEARLQARYREMLEREKQRADNLERAVEQRTQDLEAALEDVTRLSRTDPLTNLLNRRAFSELAEKSLKLAQRHERTSGLLLCDLDHFKNINDQFGHVVGDQVIVSAAQAIADAVRETDSVARFGGEEFVVLLSETNRDAIAAVGERIRHSIEMLGSTTLKEHGAQPTLSLGIALFPDHGDTLDELVSNADAALYQAKSNGRNQVRIHNPTDTRVATPRQRRHAVLVVGGERGQHLCSRLSNFDSVHEADTSEALSLCRTQRFDAIVCDHRESHMAVDFLRRTLRYRPEALRVLILDSNEAFCDVRGSHLARIDHFLLRGESKNQVSATVSDGLARRNRNSVLASSQSVQRMFLSRFAELDQIIENRELEFVYQPIVDPRTRNVFAHEALCRAIHPLFANATVLFEAAVQSGKLWELGRVTRETAIEGFSRLHGDTKMFVNLHPGEIDDPQLFIEREHANRVVFEITERSTIPNFSRFRELTQRLGTQGYEFAIDDLGAGYASLNAVATMAPEYVKIDMAMIRGIDSSPRRQQLIKRMVDFANDIGIRLVAEGVETAAEANAVAKIGCHFAQGYFYGRPEPLK